MFNFHLLACCYSEFYEYGASADFFWWRTVMITFMQIFVRLSWRPLLAPSTIVMVICSAVRHMSIVWLNGCVFFSSGLQAGDAAAWWQSWESDDGLCGYWPAETQNWKDCDHVHQLQGQRGSYRSLRQMSQFSLLSLYCSSPVHAMLWWPQGELFTLYYSLYSRLFIY